MICHHVIKITLVTFVFLPKHKRLPFVSHNHLSKHPFDLIHCDIWGPFHVTAAFFHRYFLTIVDDCTHFTWTYFLKHKYDLAKAIPRFFNMVSTQFNSTIKFFQSDNALELSFTDFFNEKVVLHQFSYVHIPQQNLVV